MSPISDKMAEQKKVQKKEVSNNDRLIIGIHKMQKYFSSSK